jgi:hypothetical protein
MKAKLTPSICYMAGLLSKSKNERNAVGIRTGLEELEKKFIEIAMKEFEIEPNRILIEEVDGKRHIYFFHSRVAKRLNEIIGKEDKVFKVKNTFSSNYLAGMFDAAGGFGKESMYIRDLKPVDEVMLANLGIHTRGGNIMNISSFVSSIKGHSVLLSQSRISQT